MPTAGGSGKPSAIASENESVNGSAIDSESNRGIASVVTLDNGSETAGAIARECRVEAGTGLEGGEAKNLGERP